MDRSRLEFLFACGLAVALVSCSPELSPSDYLHKARAHVSAGELTAATIETRNAVKIEQDNAEARLLLGDLLLRAGDAAGAEKELRKARELGIPDTATRSMLASALLLQGKFDELLAFTPDGLEPLEASQLLTTRSLGWFASGDFEISRQDADKALQLDSTSARAMLALARLDAAEDNFDSATERVKSSLNSEPTFGEAWEFLGDLEGFANRPEEALAAYTSAIEHQINTPSARLKRARINVELDKPTDALIDLDVLSRAGVKHPEIQLGRGQLKLRDGELVGAQGHFEKALNIEEGFTPALGSLALNHLLLGNLGQAEQYAKRLMTETKNSPDARRMLAAVYLENERYNLAQSTIEPVVRSGLADLSAIRLLNTALLKQAKYDDSIDLIAEFSSAALRNGSEGAADQPKPVLLRLPSEILLDETLRSSDKKEQLVSYATGQGMLSDEELLLLSAIELLVRGESPAALEAASELQGLLPDAAAPLNLTGRIHLSTQDIVQARNAFEAAIQRDDTNAAARQFLALLDAQAGDLDAARSHLEYVIKSGTQNEAVLIQLSRIEAQAGNESAMFDWIERARTVYPDSAAPAILLARYHATKNEPERAVQMLAQLNEQVRMRPDVLQLESASLILLQRMDDALPKLDRLVELEPDTAQWRFLRAIANSGNNNNRGALEDLNAALEIDPNHAASQLALASVDIQRGQLDNAFTRVESLRELIPGSTELEFIEARFEARKSESVNSAKTASTSTKATFASTEQVLAAARELWSNNERNKAIRLLKVWLEANPKDFTARLTLANAYVALDQIDAAVAQYESVLQNSDQALPPEARLVVLNNLAWYLREVDSERAVGYAQRAIEAAPDSAAALDTLAMIHFNRNDLPAAKAAFDKAVRLDVDEPTILYHGATIERALGNTEAARALLQPLIEGKLEFPESDEAIELYQSLR